MLFRFWGKHGFDGQAHPFSGKFPCQKSLHDRFAIFLTLQAAEIGHGTETVWPMFPMARSSCWCMTSTCRGPQGSARGGSTRPSIRQHESQRVLRLG